MRTHLGLFAGLLSVALASCERLGDVEPAPARPAHSASPVPRLLTRPELAVIVDLRRDNALLHLLYKAIFERAERRSDFLCDLLVRTCAPDGAPSRAATLDEVIAYVAKQPHDREQFRRKHAELVGALRSVAALKLTQQDLQSIERMHTAFFEHQLDLRFELHGASVRRYPSLEALLRQRSPDAHFGSFLARNEDFEFVRDLERRGGVLFVVGDFGKRGALRRVAAEIARRKLVLRSFYVSNVEQYLFGAPAWKQWLDNLRAFPIALDSVLVRAYLDQGRRHPQQLAGHRTATFLTEIGAWLQCEEKQPSRSYYGAVTREGCGS